MGQQLIRISALLLLLGTPVFSQEYNGPPPEQADLPYLLHAENLIPTEATEARQESRKKDTVYVTPGPASSAKTPLAEPIFILLSESIQPQQMQLYKMDVVKGNREVAFPEKRGKRTPRPLYLTYKQVEGNVYWLEVNEVLENGQYCLTPKGANNVFCFEIY